MTAPVEVRVDPESLRKLLADVRAFDVRLARALRARLRLAGADALTEIRATLREPTPKGTTLRSGGARDTIAASTRVSILAGKRFQGVRIVTSSAKLAAAHKAIMKAYNLSSWRHPAGRGSSTWVTEEGRPYFGAVIASRKVEMRAAIESALLDARRAIR